MRVPRRTAVSGVGASASLRWFVVKIEADAGGMGGASTGTGCERLGPGRELSSVRAGERELAVGVAGDRPSAFMDEVVVMPAQPAEVAGVCAAAAAPVFDVMDLADLAVAAGESADAAVALSDATAQPAGTGAAGASDADGGAVGGVDVELELAIAQKAQH